MFLLEIEQVTVHSTIADNTGIQNVFIGSYSGCKISSGCDNVAFGNRSGFCLSSGGCNVLIGQCSGYKVNWKCNYAYWMVCWT